MSVITRARRFAQVQMTDTFTPYAPTTPTTTNGFEVPAYTTGTATIGKVQGSSQQTADASTRSVKVGNMELYVIEGGLHIPISAAVPVCGEYGTGWEYVLTTLGPATDPALLNSRWLVVNAPAKSYATARRLDVVRIP